MDNLFTIISRLLHNNYLDEAEEITRKCFPSGSGFDSGTRLLTEECTPDKLVFDTSFHHMDEHGGYTDWTHHKVIVRPSLAWGFTIRVTGKNKNDIKSYIEECFSDIDTQSSWVRETIESILSKTRGMGSIPVTHKRN